mmetsp:Transcript_29531/g.60549  ORF Transcript_29531/g.60549 Transcript_29531/m.60549 type:complete len:132 (+) Transcript_29531:47-442(+)|eukprot:CAMPEP_0181317292 /NCGR_PEP_ID=MMETSP1101-20121128/16391_1 /TAXON_ID=46948 /ORGANISM="Rhodomonas abbreviata, Strain Caron Lab Isolate" /LENGTH=131 /DNA_ID=CAMNT_0023424677 /DNA_START=40 /DNA_END=435 /DNA_ORIENTATION=+
MGRTTVEDSNGRSGGAGSMVEIGSGGGGSTVCRRTCGLRSGQSHVEEEVLVATRQGTWAGSFAPNRLCVLCPQPELRARKRAKTGASRGTEGRDLRWKEERRRQVLLEDNADWIVCKGQRWQAGRGVTVSV